MTSARDILQPILQTPRLILRPLVLDDAEVTQVIFPYWKIVRYLSRVPWPYPSDGAHTYYRDVALPAMSRGDAYHWTLRLKSDPRLHIGAIGLVRNQRNDNRGFWIGLDWQKAGFMTEACAAVNNFWFDVLKIPVLCAPKAVANAASRRLSEKQGMRIVATEERDFVAGRLPAEIWELTAEDWRSHRSAMR